MSAKSKLEPAWLGVGVLCYRKTSHLRGTVLRETRRDVLVEWNDRSVSWEHRVELQSTCPQEQLEACPFCGSKENLSLSMSEHHCWISCKTSLCWISGPTAWIPGSYTPYGTFNEAAKVWNKRGEP